MAIIVTNESSLQSDPTEEAIRQALAGMDLASVQDSTTASRYAVSSVDQANVPTLVGAQIGGNSGTQGRTATQNIVGRDSVQAVTTANLVTINLLNDALAPGNTYYYGTGPTGTKGWNTLASAMAVASTARLTDTVGANGVSTFDLALVADAGGGSLLKLVRDAWGRIAGTSAPAISDLKNAGLVVPQGYIEGLQMVWNSATSISVTSGTAYIPSLGNVLVSNATLTLSGLVLTASTWYQVYLYSNAGTPAIECVTTAPVIYNGTACQKMGDASRRYVGSVWTDATANVINFNARAYGSAQDFVWMQVQHNAAPFRILNAGVAATPTTVSISNFIPAPVITSQIFISPSMKLPSGSDAYYEIAETLGAASLSGQTYGRLTNALATLSFGFFPAVPIMITGSSIQYMLTQAAGSGANVSIDLLGFSVGR